MAILLHIDEVVRCTAILKFIGLLPAANRMIHFAVRRRFSAPASGLGAKTPDYTPVNHIVF